MRQLAGDGAVRIIREPHLTMLATGIPKFFYRSLSEKALENGLLGRCLFFETDYFCPLGEMTPEALPPQVLAAASRLAARERATQETGTVTPAPVGETAAASERLRAVFAFCDKYRGFQPQRSQRTQRLCEQCVLCARQTSRFCNRL